MGHKPPLPPNDTYTWRSAQLRGDTFTFYLLSSLHIEVEFVRCPGALDPKEEAGKPSSSFCQRVFIGPAFAHSAPAWSCGKERDGTWLWEQAEAGF